MENKKMTIARALKEKERIARRLAKAKDADGHDILTFIWYAGTTVIVR